VVRLDHVALPNKGPIGRLMMEVRMIVVGIDVGLTGALAVVEDSRLVEVMDMPVIDRGKAKKPALDVVALAGLVGKLRWMNAFVIEEQGAAPGQGLGSTFRLGWQAGVIEGLVRGSGLRVELVKPHVWKAGMRLSSDKELSRQAARKLWPEAKDFERKKDHGRAEAALLARYWILAHARDAA
jgi:crossover junction endodeoxyribonuclease RuvC